MIGYAVTGPINGNLTNSPFPAVLILTKILDDSLLFYTANSATSVYGVFDELE